MAIATVLFPTLARFANRGEIDNLRATMANGMRQILFVLVPAAAAVLALSEPMIRLVYQRGDFDAAETTLVATALFWFAFSLPTNGLYLLQTRTFFSLQRPWMATGLAGLDLVVSAIAAWALYKPFGTGGIVAGTGIGTSAAAVAQAFVLRRELGGLELPRLFSTTVRITAASLALAAASYAVWRVLDEALGRGLLGEIVSLGGGLAAWCHRLPWQRRECSASPSWSRSCACCGAARCWAPGATCWVSPSWRCSSDSPPSGQLA